MFNFDDIGQYDNYVIKLSNDDYKKMMGCIGILWERYARKIDNLRQLEKANMEEFDFPRQRRLIKKHRDLLIGIIQDVLAFYKDELESLSLVFLSGSVARGTNKLASDIDLHFFYKEGKYNYIYEEVVCYIITRVIGKTRDSIDPTFIFNIQMDNKRFITEKMTRGNLNIMLGSDEEFVKYSYKEGKKRRFYLQYINRREVKLLFDYLKVELLKDNLEWVHCFEIVKGRELFEEFYEELYLKEVEQINKKFIVERKRKLRERLEKIRLDNSRKMISWVKRNYQSIVFEVIYEYVSIVRFRLIKENYEVKFLNLFDIYDIIKDDDLLEGVFKEIYRYMWTLEKLTIYCRDKGIDYGLHNDQIIDYSLEELDGCWENLKRVMIEELRKGVVRDE